MTPGAAPVLNSVLRARRTRTSPGNSRYALSPGIELSLRGKLVEDGLDELERYLERADSAGLPFMRIIHGKGTGRMREAVRAALKESAYVSSFEEAGEREGGEAKLLILQFLAERKDRRSFANE